MNGSFINFAGKRWVRSGLLSFLFQLTITKEHAAAMDLPGLWPEPQENSYSLLEDVPPDIEQSVRDGIVFLARRPYSVPQVPIIQVPNRLGLEVALVRIPSGIKSGTIQRARKFMSQVPLPLIAYDVYANKTHYDFGFVYVDSRWFTEEKASYQSFRYGRDIIVSDNFNWVFGYRFVYTSITGNRDRTVDDVSLHDYFSLMSVGGQGTLGYQSITSPLNLYAGGGMIYYKARYAVEPFLVDAPFRSNLIYGILGMSACERSRSACIGLEYHLEAVEPSFLVTNINISY